MRIAARFAFVVSVLAAVDATAAPVTFEFEGVVSQVIFPENLDGSVMAGTPFSGSYSFDPLSPNVSTDPRIAEYTATSIRVAVGNYQFRSVATTPDVMIFVENDPDVLGINSLENEAIGFFPPAPGQDYDPLLRMQWLLTGGDPLTSLALPSSPPILDQWIGNELTISADKGLVGDGLFSIRGYVTAVVPEPGSAALLAVALALLVAAANESRKRSVKRDVALKHWMIVPSLASVWATMALTPDLATAQTGGGGDVVVNNASLDVLGVGVTQHETTVAVRQVGAVTTVCVGFRDFGNQARINGYAYSLNGGGAFTDGGALPAEGGQLPPFADPSLILSSAGDFLYGSLRGGLQVLDLHASSNCSGFSHAERIVTVPPPQGYPPNTFTVDKEILAYDNWSQSPNQGSAWAAYWRPLTTEVWVAGSSDPGDNAPEWTAHERVSLEGSPPIPWGLYPWPAVAPNGDLYVAFVSGLWISVAHRSAQGGWDARTPVTTSAFFYADTVATDRCNQPALNGNMRSTVLPQIAIHADAGAAAGYVIHAVWQADPDGSGAGTDVSDVYYARSTDGAGTWSAPMRVNDDPVGSPRDQWNPALAVSPTGLVAISWYDRRLDPGNWWFDRYLRVSDNGGLRWSANLRISDVSSPVAKMIPHVDGVSSGASSCDHGDYDQLAIVGNSVHLVWSDARDVQTLPPCPDNGINPFYASQCPNPNVYYDRVVVTDFDTDGVADLTDSCPTVVNAGADADADGVDDACDTCRDQLWHNMDLGENPVFTGSMTNRTTVSGQLDDDADGIGNHCDFDHDQAGATITATDFNHMKASIGKLVSNSNCGTTGDMRCGKLDLDGSGSVISSSDFNLQKAAVGGVIGSEPHTTMSCGNTCKPPFSGPIGSGNEVLGKVVCTGVECP